MLWKLPGRGRGDLLWFGGCRRGLSGHNGLLWRRSKHRKAAVENEVGEWGARRDRRVGVLVRAERLTGSGRGRCL